MSTAPRQSGAPVASLADRYQSVRAASVALAAPLSAEDCQIQTMPDVSPTKWHLAHITWFFEEFVLGPHVTDYKAFNERFSYLFNSYYYTVGKMHARPERGLLSRPSLDEILAFRAHVDDAIDALLRRGPDEAIADLIVLGLHHEQQHQELILTDIKHVLSRNPLRPAYRDTSIPPSPPASPLRWLEVPGGEAEIGHNGAGFCFDNETPRHRVLMRPHALASRPVTNRDYLEFIRDDGYSTSQWWLSDGWAAIQQQGWRRPLYWTEDLTREFTLHGEHPIDLGAPVAHVSFYEADAYARWAGARLPTEAEWEILAADQQVAGRFADSSSLHPRGFDASGSRPQQLFGDVWEWTASPYSAYPGFTPLGGSLGEYNGKFMCNQLVLRGGSVATPIAHVRASYRNFFYPDSRWQFSGIRLAKDL